MSEFTMSALKFRNKFGVAPCNCWDKPYKYACYHFNPVYKSMQQYGDPRTEEVSLYCDECGFFGIVKLGKEYHKSDF